jgi:hypothetical protein
MRAVTNAEKVQRFMRTLGESARGPGRVYLTGGASAVLHGWRPTTVDIDLKMDPEPAGAFEALARIKDELDMNVELAAPDQFVPPARGWRDRSVFIARHGQVDFLHFDFVSQAISKIERGHARDLSDAREMLERGLVSIEALESYISESASELLRYPAVDRRALEKKITTFVTEARERTP